MRIQRGATFADAAGAIPYMTVKNIDMCRLAAALTLIVSGACAKPADTASTTASKDTTPAMHHDMAGMSGMSGGAEIKIPPGVMYRKADVEFMQGMIAHHAQAIFMTHLAATNGKNPRLLFLAKKIDQSQMPEIGLMQGWLANKNQFVPDTSSYHGMVMPGMLSDAQVAQLQKAHGTEFDKLFLQFMIQHHEGALKMVKDLLASPGAAQDTDVSVLANDIDVTQTAEIAAMRAMLADL